MMTEKYANPGLYLDEDDHGRLIEENREKYIRHEAEQVKDRLRVIDNALGAVVTAEARDALETERDQLQRRLDDLEDMDDGRR